METHYDFNTIPAIDRQTGSGEHQDVVPIPTKETKLAPKRVGSGLLNFVLFVTAGSFLVLAFAARYLGGKSVTSASWGLYLVQVSQLVISPKIQCQ